jgi:FtsP/CotA-like multicopper oxidase with cupredoxin domain
MRLDRRAALRAGTSATLWAALGAEGSAEPAQRASADGFQRLAAGPEGAPAGDAAGFRLGYEGASPGPLLRLRSGEELKIRFANRLDEPTTLCWRGQRIVNAMAGIGGLTQAAVRPGESFDYRFRPPDPGFNLYRPHAGAASADQLRRGLYGPIVVEEASPPEVELDAVALVASGLAGAPDDGLAVNENAPPLALTAAPGARVRLRLANAVGARVLAIRVAGVKPLIVAVDGQPCEPFTPLRNAFPLGPGARFDMIFDLPRDGAAARFDLVGAQAPDRPLIVAAARGEPVATRPPPAGLPANPLLPGEIDLARATRVDIRIAGGAGAPFSVNGAMQPDWPAQPLFSVARGAPVTLGLFNDSPVVQAIALYGHCMRLLHPFDDGWEPYWRDSVLIGPGGKAHVAFVADNPGRWPIESAIAAHQAAGVRTMFEVA